MKRPFRKVQLPPMVQYMLTKAAVLAGAGVVPILLFDASPRLGPWWFILVLAYLALLIWARAALLWRRERIVLRRDLGDEQFYAAFPRERRRDARRARWEARQAKKRRKQQGSVPWEPMK